MNKKEQSALRSAIRYDKLEDVIDRIENLALDIEIEDGTPLVYAVLYEKIDLVKYLIEQGANVNALYENHFTPLMSAVENENIELIKLLLEAKADVNRKDRHGNDALFKAVDTENIELIKFLVDAGANPFMGDNPEQYSAYDSAKDIESDEVVAYFDTIRQKFS